MPQPLRIGINGCLFGDRSPRGHALYAYQLCQELSGHLPGAKFFVYAPRHVEIAGLPGNWTFRTGTASSRLSPVAWLKLAAGSLCRQDDLHVFWSPYVFLPRLPHTTPALLTMYDFIYEMTPQSFPLAHSLAFRLFLKGDIARAATIITISHGTADRIQRHFGRSPVVVPPGNSSQFRRPSDDIIQSVLAKHNLARQRYLFNVAALSDPRKNLGCLVKTFLAMKRDGLAPEHRLVLAGNQDSVHPELERLLARDGGTHVLLLGYVDKAHLPALYAGTDAFIFPSLYEGFGMPVREARACGTRVVATDLPELREAGDEHCIYIPPTEDGIREGICAALNAPRGAIPTQRIWPTWQESAGLLAAQLTAVAHRC